MNKRDSATDAALPETPDLPHLIDIMCDAEQLHGLIMAAELTMEEIGAGTVLTVDQVAWDRSIDAENRQDSVIRVIMKQDEKTLRALLRVARQFAEKLEADLGVLA